MAGKHRKDNFGSWRIDVARSLLVHQKSGYEIDLLELNRPAQMLNCIFQVNAQSWAIEADLGGLVQALGYVFDPRSTMCSGGQDQRFSAREYLQQRLGSVRPRSR
jgi:hypothetical protein